MLRLRQVALVAHDLTAAESEIADALEASVCFRDPGVGEFGLHNALFAVGDQFLEVVSPTEDDTTAGRLLDRRGDGGYMAIFQVDSLDRAAERLERLGVRIVYDAQGDGVRGLHLHPRDVPGAIVSIDETTDEPEWPWAGTEWRDHASRVATAVTGITVSVEDPASTCSIWASVLGVDVAAEATDLVVDDAIVRFRPAVGDRIGITAIELRAASDVERTVPPTLVGVGLSTVSPSD